MSFRPIYKTLGLVDVEKLDFQTLSKNHNAITLLLQNIDRIDSAAFSLNTHPIAVNMLSSAFHRINWTNLSENSSAAHILLKNPHRAHTYSLHFNPNSEVLEILEKNPDKINIITNFIINLAGGGDGRDGTLNNQNDIKKIVTDNLQALKVEIYKVFGDVTF